jgi:hypothetical protein
MRFPSRSEANLRFVSFRYMRTQQLELLLYICYKDRYTDTKNLYQQIAFNTCHLTFAPMSIGWNGCKTGRQCSENADLRFAGTVNQPATS